MTIFPIGFSPCQNSYVSEDENEEIDLKEDFDTVMDDVEDNCSDKEKTQWGKWSCIVCNAKAKKCWLIRRLFTNIASKNFDIFSFIVKAFVVYHYFLANSTRFKIFIIQIVHSSHVSSN
jgi:hypothetical protein